MIPALVCSIYIRFFTKVSRPPETIMFIFAILAFIMSIQWVAFTSNIVVDLLAVLGIMTNLPKSLLGLTLLAWGNCMGDLSADVAMTRKGFGEMAITGCMAGPIFNILCGVGSSCCMILIKHMDESIPFSLNNADGSFNKDAVLPLGLLSAEIPALIVIGCNAIFNDYHIAKPLCMINLGIYFIVIISLVIFTLT
jgi:Ca2+/Na+ antiporter